MSEENPSAVVAKSPPNGEATLDGVVQAWWKDLDRRRGERAELRRCDHPAKIAISRGYHRLLGALHEEKIGLWHEDRWLPALVGVLAHVEHHVSSASTSESSGARVYPSIGRQLATRGAGRTGLSDLRFRKLLRADNAVDLMRLMSDAVRLLDGNIDVRALSRDFSRLLTEEDEGTKQRWARDFYAVYKDS